MRDRIKGGNGIREWQEKADEKREEGTIIYMPHIQAEPVVSSPALGRRLTLAD